MKEEFVGINTKVLDMPCPDIQKTDFRVLLSTILKSVLPINQFYTTSEDAAKLAQHIGLDIGEEITYLFLQMNQPPAEFMRSASRICGEMGIGNFTIHLSALHQDTKVRVSFEPLVICNKKMRGTEPLLCSFRRGLVQGILSTYYNRQYIMFKSCDYPRNSPKYKNTTKECCVEYIMVP